MIFVFGSNLAGIHGAGAALWARKYRGAIDGVEFGKQNSSFAIPTKDKNIRTLPLNEINNWVNKFILQAKFNYYDCAFQVTCIGCGLAGLQHKDIAPMFLSAPDNCYFDTLWKPWLLDKNYWGTF